eukprot:TRINITY_DN6076_c0_g1_i2.p1 TRINITY_DN6076_c0_g1~~TRINITY_DN6076_c0_g1_i2.p1  ORF type:complete len:630 (+),score=143.35 TRINITY_DN6076_c0_g1_i2:206-1891(+)
MVVYGNHLVDAELVQCVASGPGQLLLKARAVLDVTYTLALLYRLNGNETYAKRAIAEMVNVAVNCTDWNPEHFLDVGEMTHAVAIGYDWLYDQITPEDKVIIEEAALKFGIVTGVTAYRGEAWWATTDCNWNFVCAGGLAAGALAFYDANSTFAANASTLLYYVGKGTPHAWPSYGPTGAWPEGPNYWGYATKYALLLIDIVPTLLPTMGSDWVHTPGFLDTGLYRIHHAGPNNRTFAWADSSEETLDEFVPNFMLLAKLNPTLRNVYAYRARELWGNVFPQRCQLAGCAQMLLSYSNAGSQADIEHLNTTVYYDMGIAGFDDHTIVGAMRTSWSKQAAWLGFKGGNGEVNHNDLDAGTFVFDMKGQHWAIDFGAGDYGLPGYFDKGVNKNQRYWWYRKSTLGHNTWCFNESDATPGFSDQHLDALTTISAHTARSAEIDLTPAYKHYGATSMIRSFSLNGNDDNPSVIVHDRIATEGKYPMEWTMNTRADITIDQDGLTAQLSYGGESVTATLDGPEGVTFSSKRVDPQPPNKKIAGVTRLMIVLTAEQSVNASLTVKFS